MPSIFGQRIKARLKQLRQTQRWLANQTDIPEQTISNLVNSRYDDSGSISQAVPIAKALNTTVDYLYGLTTSPDRPIWPSAKVRRLAMLAERLPDSELDGLIGEASRKVKASGDQLWRNQVEQAIEGLVQRHGGDVEATLRTLDQLVNELEPKPSGDSEPSPPTPSLLDEWQK
jgi:transcriptional regulator with XRE-family HTH domain